MSLLDGLVRNVQKASANLSGKSVKKLTIRWGELIDRELPEERRFTPEVAQYQLGMRVLLASARSDCKISLTACSLYRKLFLQSQ